MHTYHKCFHTQIILVIHDTSLLIRLVILYFQFGVHSGLRVVYDSLSNKIWDGGTPLTQTVPVTISTAGSFAVYQKLRQV